MNKSQVDNSINLASLWPIILVESRYLTCKYIYKKDADMHTHSNNCSMLSYNLSQRI